MVNEKQYRKQMLDTFLASMPLLVMAFFYYGPRVLGIAGISVLSAVVTDYICLLFQGELFWRKHDYSAVITGILFALLLPASVPYWLVITGSVFAVAVVRHPFGGHYNTLFHPAMTAYAFVMICFNTLVTRYPMPMQQLPLEPVVNVPLYTSPAYRLMLGGVESIDWIDSLLGNFVGPMGTTCVVVLLCCGLYLMVRKTIIWQIPVAAFSVVTLFAYLMPRVSTGHLTSIKLELVSGVFIFAVLFVAAMDNGEIKTWAGKWMYGIILGLLVVLFRNLSKIELVCPFVIIIMNAIDDKCDSYAKLVPHLLKMILRFIKFLLGELCRVLRLLWDSFFKLVQRIVEPPKK